MKFVNNVLFLVIVFVFGTLLGKCSEEPNIPVEKNELTQLVSTDLEYDGFKYTYFVEVTFFGEESNLFEDYTILNENILFLMMNGYENLNELLRIEVMKNNSLEFSYSVINIIKSKGSVDGGSFEMIGDSIKIIK